MPGLAELLSTSLGPFKVKVWLGILVALAMVAGVIITIADNRDKRMVDTAKDAGAASAVIQGQQDTLEQVERAKNVEDEIARGGDADRYERCLRNATARSRANCARFKPVPD